MTQLNPVTAPPQPVVVQAPARPVQRRRFRLRPLVPYLLFLPAGLLLVLFNLFTAGLGIGLSFLDWNWNNIEQRFDFVGLKHYAALARDAGFWKSLTTTTIWTLAVVPGSFLVGLYFALLLNEEIRYKGFFRTVLLLPWATPLVVAAVLWAFILSPGVGLLNSTLAQFGRMDLKFVNWLGNPDYALWILVMIQIWRWAPFFTITLLAGLQAIPKDLYEAAEIDGAGPFQRFRSVTMPMMSSVAAVVALQGIIWSVHNYTLIYVLTGGGPVDATEVLTIHLWKTAFPLGQLAKGAAIGTVMIGILSIVGTIWVMRLMRREVTQ
jgi:multiple sugar transport system permease protein